MNARDCFFDEVYQAVKRGKDMVVVSADIGAPSLDDFRRDFPHRFVNVGIAEQNLVAVASGLQLAGKTAIVYGLNPFPATRAFDQIRNIMASLKIPLAVTALNAGTCSAEAGFSHIAIENLSVMRTLRNIQFINPSDETIARKSVDEISTRKTARFVQFDKYVEGKLYQEGEIDFGRGFVGSVMDDAVTVVSYGITAHEIKKAKLPCRLLDCFSLPVDKDAFVGELKRSRKILTVEDGIAEGGIGSMVLEVLNDYGLQIPVKRLALKFDGGYPHRFTNRSVIWQEEGISLAALEQELGK